MPEPKRYRKKAEKTCNQCGETKALTEYYRWTKSGKPYARCKQCIKDKSKDWARANPAKMRARNARYAERHPEKIRAKRILNTRVAEGRMEKPSVCEGCGKEGVGHEIHAHHTDYSKPVDVRWLCPKCHTAEHHKPKSEAAA